MSGLWSAVNVRPLNSSDDDEEEVAEVDDVLQRTGELMVGISWALCG